MQRLRTDLHGKIERLAADLRSYRIAAREGTSRRILGFMYSQIEKEKYNIARQIPYNTFLVFNTTLFGSVGVRRCNNDDIEIFSQSLGE